MDDDATDLDEQLLRLVVDELWDSDPPTKTFGFLAARLGRPLEEVRVSAERLVDTGRLPATLHTTPGLGVANWRIAW